MKTYRWMSPERLQAMTREFPRRRIAVLGDFFLDKYMDLDPTLSEVSIETGKPAHQVTAISHTPGAAGTVVRNLAALGAQTLFAIGLVGDDGEGYDLRNDLQELGCGADHLHADPERLTPTYLKPRDKTEPGLAGEQARYDTKNRTPTSLETQQRIIASLDSLLPHVDAVIVADQVEEDECGVVTRMVREAVEERVARSPRTVFWVDSRCRINQFRGPILKPNQFEAAGIANPPQGQAMPMAQIGAAIWRLRKATGSPICLTRGEEGMIVTDPDPIAVPGVRVDGPTDPTGAGDSATAGAVLALTAGAELHEAALIANLVASITIQQLGTTGTASVEDLPERLKLWQQQNKEET